MKKYILTITALCIAITVFSQNTDESRNILSRVSTAFEASNGVKLSFMLHIIELNGDTFHAQSGEAQIRGDRFHLTMDAVDVWFDGITQWTLMHDIDEVYINTPSAGEIATISPLALLGMYRSGFQISAPVSKTVNEVSAHVIEMTPASENDHFQTISVAIDKQTNTVVQVNLTMDNGMKTRIDITDYNANHNFPDHYFVFPADDFQNVIIVDLR